MIWAVAVLLSRLDQRLFGTFLTFQEMEIVANFILVESESGQCLDFKDVLLIQLAGGSFAHYKVWFISSVPVFSRGESSSR